MTKLLWDKTDERTYETGIDRGVLYLTDNSGVPWNGLTAVDEDLSGWGTTQHYFDGIKYYDSQQTPSGFTAKLNALTFPDEFLEFEGFRELETGIFVDDQPIGRFGLVYRTLIGSALDDDLAYKLHLVYNLSAEVDPTSYISNTNTVIPVPFAWTLNAVPENVEGFKPTAHIIIDSREVEGFVLEALEDILYGTDTTEPHLPTWSELMDFFGNAGTIIITDHGDGTWTAEGPDDLVYSTGPDSFEIDEVNATYLDADTYNVSTT